MVVNTVYQENKAMVKGNALPNPKHVMVEVSAYVAAHGKRPSGFGTWAFGLQPNTPVGSPDMFWSTGLYSEARRQAQARFAGRVAVYVQS